MKQATDFLIDISDKMDKKLSITQKLLTDEIAPNFDFSGVFGMRIFKSVCGSPIIIKSLDLAEPNQKDDFIKKSTSLPYASGGAPIAETIKESISSLKSIDADAKRIILITTGEDTDGGVIDYEVEKANADVQLNIIGINMKDSDLRSAEKAAQLTNGVCCNIPEDKFQNASAIHEIVAPIIDAMNGKIVSFTASAPKVEVKQEAPKAEVKVEAPKVTIEEPKAEAPRMAAFVQQPQPAHQKAEEQKPKQTIEINNKDFAKAAEAVQAVSVAAESAKDEFDAVAALQQANSSIESLLKENMETLQRVIKNGEAIAKENQQLRSAEAENLNSIKSLQATIVEANDTIQQLKQVVSDKDAEIEALNVNKNDLQTAINQWMERDKQVVIDLDASQREATSAASEKILFDYLEKKYPSRVKWCNEKAKESKGYDFEIVDLGDNGTECYIACKGAKDDTKTFFLTEKEWNMCLNNNLNYQVYLVRNVDSTPKIIWIDNLIGWMMSGKVRPGALRNEKVKAGQVMLTLTK